MPPFEKISEFPRCSFHGARFRHATPLDVEDWAVEVEPARSLGEGEVVKFLPLKQQQAATEPAASSVAECHMQTSV